MTENYIPYQQNPPSHPPQCPPAPSRGSRSGDSAFIIIAAVVEVVVGGVGAVAGAEVRVDRSGRHSDVAEHGRHGGGAGPLPALLLAELS